MELILRVKKSERISIIADGSEQLEVTIQLIDKSGEKARVVEEKRLGFPLTTPKDEIVAQLKQYLANYRAEQENKVINKERDELGAAVSQTIEQLDGGVIS